MNNLMKSKLYLKLKNNWHCHQDGHNYEFKETTNGRFFVWKSKYSRSEISRMRDIENSNRVTYHESLELEKEGHCFEVGKKSYKRNLTH